MEIYGVDFLSLILPFTTILISFAFVFGNSLRMIWESFIVVFVIRPFLPGDYLEVAGEDFTVSRISLLTTAGYTPDGRHICFPNQIFISSPAKNWGLAAASRIKLIFRMKIDDALAAQDIVLKLGKEMRQYCKDRRTIYLHKSFVCWADPFDDDATHDDLSVLSLAFQVNLTSITVNRLTELRELRTTFINEVRRRAAAIRAHGVGVSKLDLWMDNSVTLPGFMTSSATTKDSPASQPAKEKKEASGLLL